MPDSTWPSVSTPLAGQPSSHMSHHTDSSRDFSRYLPAVIALVILLYAGAAVLGLPQHGTTLINAAHAEHHDTHAEAHALDGHHADAAHHADTGHTDPAVKFDPPPLWTVIPFAMLLGAIAILPLIPATEHWWEHNSSRFMVATLLGLVTLAYYLFLHAAPIDRHFLGHGVSSPVADGLNIDMAWTIIQNAILNEYIPFIMVLFALYAISGGIRIQGDLPAHPLTNTAFIATGGLLASFIGTTGAAMVLIRPLLETNSERQRVTHTVIFFIFVVCNCGGCLLPIGDPPLFLGYLQGVDFLWTMTTLWPQWLLVNSLLLAIYYLWDRYYSYPRETADSIARDETMVRRLRFHGLGLNVPLLLGVVLAVALLDPSKPLPGTGWYPWLYLREIVQLGLVGLALWLGSRALREANRFSFAPIIEVAALFLGIFICMQPALQILDVRGPSLGIDTPMKFFWYTGGLSAVLDNAPTYLVFFKTARALPVEETAITMAGVEVGLLAAISLGAVFMGAMTYIGNGPNFMVKAIAERSNIRMPSFFGYTLYSMAILLPVLVLTTLISNWLWWK